MITIFAIRTSIVFFFISLHTSSFKLTNNNVSDQLLLMFRKDTKGETDILHEIKTKELRESANRVLRLKTNLVSIVFAVHLHGFKPADVFSMPCFDHISKSS